jgi:4-hydroxybenzoate polyprenyltransferase/phosphoserine phosphatase
MLDRTVLVVDMDGTLVLTDTLHEAVFSHVAHDVRRLFPLASWIGAGKAAFKRRLADACVLAGDALPLDPEVVALVRAARAEGRRTALVSAADQRQVEAVAAHLGLFDEAYGTGGPDSGGRNLSGAAKAEFLVRRYGARGFDYVGDGAVDAPVWAAARRAITVGANGGLRALAERAGAESVAHLRPPAKGLARLRPYLRAMRPHQWAKNALVFMPVLAAHEPGGLGAALAAFIAFSLIASSVYLINDMLDLAADRAHPRKRLRPFAAGEIPLSHGLVLAPALALTALAIAVVFTPLLFLGVLGLYYVATFAYSMVLKRKLIIDIITLAGLYTLRILGGAAAASVTLSPWMLAFSMFLFLALAAVKRQAELTDQARDGRAATPGRGYRTDDLPVLRGIGLSAGNAAVMVFALYINSPAVRSLYAWPQALWLVCPLLLYWVCRMVMMTHRGNMTDDPIVYAATDRVSQVVIALAAMVVVGAALL